MKPSTRLDSVVFQLTPTRTRCDLVITANGKTEKIASGLLNPFLAHLKAAQEQIGKGGYSIVLEPNRGSDAPWFSKGTVERFVRFVSTPEILERVYTIESEILQIEEAISFQNNNDTGLHIVEDPPAKPEESIEGGRPLLGGNEEKAIVLYQPVSHEPQDVGSTVHEKNSKVQLVRVLETRKTVLQKEQGMAFARALAASFDIDSIAALLSFAECFGASRMMDACKRFVDLWKAKHESGQWVEVEATEALPSVNASGIVFLSSNEQREFKESWPHSEFASDKNGIPSATSADMKPQADHQVQPNPQDYVPGQFPYPMFPPWQMHPLQSYPMQGMPYYPGNTPFFQPPYPPYDDSRLHSGQKTRHRRHSMDSRDMSAEEDSGRTMEDDGDMDEEDSGSRRARKKGGKSSRKQLGTVLIRNINYISSAKKGSSDSDPQSETEEESVKVDQTIKSKKKGVYPKSDDGHWQAFQNFLLNDADESNNSPKSSMFEMEGKVQGKKRPTAIGDASSVLGGHNMGVNQDVGFSEHHDISRDVTRMPKPMEDQMLSYGREVNPSHSTDSQNDLHFTVTGDQRGGYRRPADTNMEYMINQQEKLTDLWDSSLDPVIANGVQNLSNRNNGGSSHGMVDESLMIIHRSGSLDPVASDGRKAMDMDYELPSVLQKAESYTFGSTSQSNYEPNDLNLMPDRLMVDRSSSYDPALDYEMQAQVNDSAKPSGKKEVNTDAKEGPRKVVKDQKLKADRKITAITRREKPSKLSPSEDARARAEKLRAFKADLQKQKKEKEEEQMKRLEALKIERQKRIAARSGTNPAQSPVPSQQARKQLPKLSPVSQKNSKFSDTEPGSSSPLQRSKLRAVIKVSNDSNKASKSGRLNNGSHASGNQLTRSASSLSVRKEDNNGLTPDSKATMPKIRRFSEPKGSVNHISSGKIRSAQEVSRRRVSEGSEIKKTPPELKLRTSKGTSVRTQKKPATKEILPKPNDKMPSSANLSGGNADISSPSDGDDNTVVEKTVVMLGSGKPSIPVLHASKDKTSITNMRSDDVFNPGGKSEDDVAIPPPASPITVKEVNREPSGGQVKVDSYDRLNETGAAYREKVSPNIPKVDTTEKPYQAPYARVSSLEDPCMAKSDYGKAPPTSLAGGETTTVHECDGQREGLVKIPETSSGKHSGKETSKGFRRLLKFGKKNSAASETIIESDKASLDGSVADDYGSNVSSSEVFTLRNLLTQEETSSSGATPKKSSRSFSLLSPFRSSKTSEKKSTMT